MFKNNSNFKDDALLSYNNEIIKSIECSERNFAKIKDILNIYIHDFSNIMILIEHFLFGEKSCLLSKDEKDMIFELEERLYSILIITGKSDNLIMECKEFRVENDIQKSKWNKDIFTYLDRNIRKKSDEIQVFKKLNIDLANISDIFNYPIEIVERINENDTYVGLRNRKEIELALKYAEMTAIKIAEKIKFYLDNFIMSMLVIEQKVIDNSFNSFPSCNKDIIYKLKKNLYTSAAAAGCLDFVKNEFENLTVTKKDNTYAEELKQVNISDLYYLLKYIRSLIFS